MARYGAELGKRLGITNWSNSSEAALLKGSILQERLIGRRQSAPYAVFMPARQRSLNRYLALWAAPSRQSPRDCLAFLVCGVESKLSQLAMLGSNLARR